jgi:hypothetical protein
VNSGASDHITSKLEKMTIRDKYSGQDQVHTTSGAGMKISNIGHSVLHTPDKNLHLKNILNVPSANKSFAIYSSSRFQIMMLSLNLPKFLSYKGSGHKANSASRNM